MSLYRLSDVHKGLGMPNSQTSPTDKEAGWSSSMSHPKFRLNLDRKPTSASSVISTFLRSLSATPLPDRHCDVLVIIDA